MKEKELAEERRKQAERDADNAAAWRESMEVIREMKSQLNASKTAPSPSLPVSLIPALASELHNISGVSTNSASATASAASGLRHLASGEAAQTGVSVTLELDVDDLALSQFPFAHVPELTHRPSMHDDDPYDLDVDLGDMEQSFSSLTEQYAPHAGRDRSAAEPGDAGGGTSQGRRGSRGG
jgi:hypothetical protein